MKRKWCNVVLSFVCAASVLLGAVTAKAEVIHEKDLEDYILSQMSSAHISGMSISIVNSEKELYCAAYGVAEKTTKDYVLGDLSKSFTAAAIMRLAEDSELRLEDPVGDYLPEYHEISDVTIEDLLHHTSGITKYEVMSDIQAKGKRGTFEFANANYNLLGKIIEAVTGASYIEYVSDNFLDPLEMESTYSLANTEGFEGEMAKGYRNYFGFPFSYVNEYDKEEEWMQISSNYIISDVKDMGNYLRMYLQNGGEVLSAESVKAMLSNGVPIEGDRDIEAEIIDSKAQYMLGWIEKEINGQKMLYHTGTVENYTASMILLPEKDMGISLLFNTSDAVAGQKLIEQLEAGILAIQMEQKAEGIDGKLYFVKHGLLDIGMVILVLAAWGPIFFLGFWKKRRRNNLWSPVGIGIDVLVHIVLPTILFAILQQAVPLMWIKRFLPSVDYFFMAVILSLYAGAVIKVIAMLIYGFLGQGDAAEADISQESGEGEKTSQEKDSQDKQDTKNNSKDGTAQNQGADTKKEKGPAKAGNLASEEKREKAAENKTDKKDKSGEEKTVNQEKAAKERADKEKQAEQEKADKSEKKNRAEEGKADKKDKEEEGKSETPEKEELSKEKEGE